MGGGGGGKYHAHFDLQIDGHNYTLKKFRLTKKAIVKHIRR